jgi:copper oxidase (laccase) domain-containing protein
MTELGIHPSHISDCGICTCHTTYYPSWRRDSGTPLRLLTAIHLSNQPTQ